MLKEEWQLDLPLKEEVDKSDTITDEDILDKVVAAADELFTSKLQAVGAEQFTPFMRMVLLQSMDSHWREHLAALDYLRQGIHLRGYAQKNPKQEYKREAFELFSQLLDVVKMEVTRLLMTVRIQSQEQVAQAAEEIEARASQVGNVTYTHPNEDGSVSQEAEAGDLGRRRGAEGRPQRALPLRQRQEVQELPRQAGLRPALGRLAARRHCRGSYNRRSPCRESRHARQPDRPRSADAAPRAPASSIGVAMAGVRKANRRDLTVVTLAEGSQRRRRVHREPLLRRAGAAVPRAPGGRRGHPRASWSTPATPTPAPAPTAWRGRARPARRWPRSWASRPSRCCRFPPA